MHPVWKDADESVPAFAARTHPAQLLFLVPIVILTTSGRGVAFQGNAPNLAQTHAPQLNRGKGNSPCCLWEYALPLGARQITRALYPSLSGQPAPPLGSATRAFVNFSTVPPQTEKEDLLFDVESADVLLQTPAASFDGVRGVVVTVGAHRVFHAFPVAQELINSVDQGRRGFGFVGHGAGRAVGDHAAFFVGFVTPRAASSSAWAFSSRE